MNINFSKKEYRLLLDLIYMVDWVIHAHETGSRKESDPYSDLIQKLLSYAKNMECEDVIEFDKNLGRYFHTLQFEQQSEAENLIEEFENETFWSELISRLAKRDALKEIESEKWHDMSAEERYLVISNAEEKWSKEFEQYGLDRIQAGAKPPF